MNTVFKMGFSVILTMLLIPAVVFLFAVNNICIVWRKIRSYSFSAWRSMALDVDRHDESEKFTD